MISGKDTVSAQGLFGSSGNASNSTSNSSVPTLAHNLTALQERNFKTFCNEIPSADVILSVLQSRGMLVGRMVEPLPMSSFSGKVAPLNVSPVDLLPTPIGDSLQQYTVHHIPPAAKYPIPLLPLSINEKINKYCDAIVDVLKSELAQQPYEAGVDLQENVTEREHALQAGKLMYLLGFPLGDILELLLHDIARPTSLPEHGHRFHCEEGSTILQPLELSTDYCFYHAFAKYLLNEFSPTYKAELISPVSQYSLSLQTENFQKQLEKLPTKDSKALTEFLFKIMFMRLVDDFSKVPKKAFKQEVDYFSDIMIRNMVFARIRGVWLQKLCAKKNFVEDFVEYEAKLDAALALLKRGKEYSCKRELSETSLANFARRS